MNTENMSITVEDIREFCPTCAEEMLKSGVSSVPVEKFLDMPELVEKAKKKRDKREHIGFEDPGFFTRCVAMMSKREGITDPNGLCAMIHQRALGRWPGEDPEKRKKVKKSETGMIIGEVVKHMTSQKVSTNK